jgi:hypothetical protein
MSARLLGRAYKEWVVSLFCFDQNQSCYSDFITKHIETTPLFIVENFKEVMSNQTKRLARFAQ